MLKTIAMLKCAGQGPKETRMKVWFKVLADNMC